MDSPGFRRTSGGVERLCGRFPVLGLQGALNGDSAALWPRLRVLSRGGFWMGMQAHWRTATAPPTLAIDRTLDHHRTGSDCAGSAQKAGLGIARWRACLVQRALLGNSDFVPLFVVMPPL